MDNYLTTVLLRQDPNCCRDWVLHVIWLSHVHVFRQESMFGDDERSSTVLYAEQNYMN
jgi:hypothetical protein